MNAPAKVEIVSHWSKDFDAAEAAHKPLRRYMDLSAFQLLLSGKAFLSTIANLRNGNDPQEGDGAIDRMYVEKQLDGIPRLKEFIDTASYWKYSGWRDSGARLAGEFGGLEQDPSPAERFFHLASRTRCAWSWFASEHESSAMWEVFGKSGVAVTTTLDRLQRALAGNVSLAIGDVRYRARTRGQFGTGGLDSAKEGNLVLRPYLVKGREFESETEIRVVTSCNLEAPGAFVTLDPFELIQEVTVYPFRDEWKFGATASIIKTLLESPSLVAVGDQNQPERSVGIVPSSIRRGSYSGSGLAARIVPVNPKPSPSIAIQSNKEIAVEMGNGRTCDLFPL